MAHHGIDADELRLIPIDWVVWVTAGDLGDHGLGLISLSTLAGAELSGPRSCCQPATCFARRQNLRRFLCHGTLLSRASHSCATARFGEGHGLAVPFIGSGHEPDGLVRHRLDLMPVDADVL